jgi:surface antigen
MRIWSHSLNAPRVTAAVGISLAVLMSLAGVAAAAPALADTVLCSGTSYSVCINAGYTDHGYHEHSGTSYWGADTGHNCTNYVAYVETLNGVARPSYHLGNAWQWWSEASGHVPENGTPAVGAVAWWGKNQGGVGSAGHVAYVEAVGGNGSITISEDAFPSGPFDWRVISAGSARWPGGFIHFKDLSASPGAAIMPTSDGHIQVFADASGTLQENWYDSGTGQVGGWSSVAGMTVQGTPALVARSGQTVIDAFIRNSAGQIVETWYNWGTGQWGGWITVDGGTFTSDPSAVATSDGHDQVFATSSSGTLAMNWFDPGSGQIGGGSSVAGMTVQGTPALVARSGQTVIDAFIRNSAGQIVETWYNWGTGQWGGWIAIAGATFSGAPQAVATPDGHDQIFASNNGTIEQNWFAPGTGHIGDWITI